MHVGRKRVPWFGCWISTRRTTVMIEEIRLLMHERLSILQCFNLLPLLSVCALTGRGPVILPSDKWWASASFDHPRSSALLNRAFSETMLPRERSPTVRLVSRWPFYGSPEANVYFIQTEKRGLNASRCVNSEHAFGEIEGHFSRLVVTCGFLSNFPNWVVTKRRVVHG